METTGQVDGWVDGIGGSAVAATDALLRAGYGVQPPTVHVLLDALDPPYLGYLTCRPFYRGREPVARWR